MPASIKPFDLSELEEVYTIGRTVTVPSGKHGAWHVFTDNRDEWYELTKEAEARAKFDEWAKDFGCARLYLEIEDLENEPDEFGECWESFGPYPS